MEGEPSLVSSQVRVRFFPVNYCTVYRTLWPILPFEFHRCMFTQVCLPPDVPEGDTTAALPITSMYSS